MKIAIQVISQNKDYEGYLWYSDQERPTYIGKNLKAQGYTPEDFRIDMLSYKPFVVEGALYDKESGIGISIRCIDGQYFVYQYDVKNIKDNTEQYQIIEHTWQVSKDKDRRLKMLEVWQRGNDPLCADMPAFRPAFWVFAGFLK